MLLLARLDCMILRSYDWIGLDTEFSTSLRKKSIQVGLDIIESAISLETDPRLAPWAWYAAAFQQYHSVLPLVMELYQQPEMDQRDRILALVDYIFGPSYGVPTELRTGTILKAVRKNLRSFISVSGIPDDSDLKPGQVWNRVDVADASLSNMSEDFFMTEQEVDSVNYPNPTSSFLGTGSWWHYPGDEGLS